jgi:hypothetical protein
MDAYLQTSSLHHLFDLYFFLPRGSGGVNVFLAMMPIVLSGLCSFTDLEADLRITESPYSLKTSTVQLSSKSTVDILKKRSHFLYA